MSQFPTSSAPPQGNPKLVIVAVVVALAAVVLVSVYIEMVRREAVGDTFTVYRLTRRVEPGDTLSQRDVEAEQVPARFAEAFSDAVDPTGLEARLSTATPFRRHADRRDVLTFDLFVDPTQDALDRRISLDMREVALPVDARSLPAGLRPGSYVDIAALFPGGPTHVLTVLERVRVFAIGTYSIVDEAANEGAARLRNYSTISIEVTPEQAIQLHKIKRIAIGGFDLDLRNPADPSQPRIPTGGINPDVLRLINNPAYTLDAER